MTEQYLALNPSQHRTHGFKRAADLAHFRNISLLPIHLGELTQAQSAFPLAFAQGQAGWDLVALQALTPNDNLFIDEAGGYLGGIYLPQALRTYPFTLLEKTASEQTQYFLGFDQHSDLYREAPDASQGEERFFDDAGQPSKFMQQLTAFMSQRVQHQRGTQRAVAQLAENQLLQPWGLSEHQTEGKEPAITGLHRLNVAAFQDLSGDVLKALQVSGALAIAYAQIYSMPHLRTLQALQQRRQQVSRTSKTQVQRPANEIAQNLLNRPDETLKFNF